MSFDTIHTLSIVGIKMCQSYDVSQENSVLGAIAFDFDVTIFEKRSTIFQGFEKLDRTFFEKR